MHVQGHTATIEDVVWRPGSRDELASVGDDYKLLLWDSRLPSARPAAAVENAHGETDVQCVDWSALQQELLVTGAVIVAGYPCKLLCEPIDPFSMVCKTKIILILATLLLAEEEFLTPAPGCPGQPGCLALPCHSRGARH